MFKIIVLALVSAFRSRQRLALENASLRRQIEGLRRNTSRPLAGTAMHHLCVSRFAIPT